MKSPPRRGGAARGGGGGGGRLLAQQPHGRELGAVVDRISEVRQKELGSERFTRYEERFQIPLALALACFLAEGLLSERVRSRREWRGRFA